MLQCIIAPHQRSEVRLLSGQSAETRKTREMSGKLDGLKVLVPESRELDLFAAMLEAQGAVTLRCPLVTILDVEDFAPIEAWLARLIAGEFDDLILLTGEGLRRLLARADHIGKREQAVAAISKLRTIVRGPKPTRVLREIGLTPGITAAAPTSQGIIESLRKTALAGRTVGVQLYPGAPDVLTQFLSAAGARVAAVTPYRYASQAEDDRVVEAIKQMADGTIDFVAFTSSPQVQRLVEVARKRGIEGELKQGFAKTRIAAVGPVVGAAIEALGAKVSVQPTSFHLKPLVVAIGEAAESRSTT